MRPIYAAIVTASLAVPGLAHAQSHKVGGASLAGLCAASLEFVAGARQSAGVVEPQHLLVIQSTRDLYLGIPKYPEGEVHGYATAWSERMSRDFSNAADDRARGAVATDIGSIARDCQEKMFAEYRAAQQRGEIPQNAPTPAPAQPLTVQPAQPLTVQPVQPLTVQPLETQPLIINPQ